MYAEGWRAVRSFRLIDGAAELFERRVDDGYLVACVFFRAAGIELKVTFRDGEHRLSRVPTPVELADARGRFLPSGMEVVRSAAGGDPVVAVVFTEVVQLALDLGAA